MGGFLIKRFAVLVVALAAVVAVVSTSAMAGGTKASLIYNSTVPNGPPANVPSIGPEAYAFNQLGNGVTFAGSARHLTSVTVGLSSWACSSGAWYSGDCSTPSGATFRQAITFNVYDSTGTVLASSTQTFSIPYRPSASPKCTGEDAGKWYSPSLKTCFNGFYNEVTFNFSGVTLPNQVVYGIEYNTRDYGPTSTGVAGPSDSLNIALVNEPGDVTAGADTTPGTLWEEHSGSSFASTTEWATYVPAVQFKAGT
jgi:hypothetical protein